MRLLFLALLFLTGCGQYQSNTVTRPALDTLLSPCDDTVNVAISGLVSKSLCGTLSVYENRTTGSGRKIDLNIMVIPAIATNAAPDPIFFLAGGPGQAAVSIGPYVFSQIPEWRQDRDIVLVDQRGTGKSNSMACLSSDELAQIDISNATMETELSQLENCLETLDADTRLYTTPIAMDDLNQVREYLGYEKINLMGISYGTRAALVYMRRHGETVRTAVLDAVAPTTMVIPENVAIDAERAFELLVQDCAKQTACNKNYPKLMRHYERLVARLEQVETLIDITHPLTGQQRTIHLQAEIIDRLVRSVLYDRTLSRLLPLAIEEAYDENYTPLMTLAQLLFNPDQAISAGMLASVLCAEDMQRMTSGNPSTHFSNPLFETLDAVCKFWPTTPIEASYFEPVTSDVPVLLTSGVLDPITPPKYAIEALQTLSNAEHIIVPGAGHGAMTQGCMPEVINRFLDSASVKDLEAGCAVNIQRQPFFTSFAGVLEQLKDPEPVK